MCNVTKLGYIALLLAVGAGFSCGKNPSSKEAGEALVTVNGVPIGKEDVRFVLKSKRGHKGQETLTQAKDILKGIIQDELVYQRAIEIGLDADPNYQQELRKIEAQLNAFKRKELAKIFHRKQILKKVDVSDAEARQYFEKNVEWIKSEVHVWQILRRDSKEIEKDLEDLSSGSSFEEVARKRFPKLPTTGQRPWDLGYLKWQQVPQAWREVVYNLSPGSTSGIISGPNRRFWIIKLIDKQENPELIFEDVRPAIVEIIRSEKVETLRKRTQRELRERAQVVFFTSSDEDSIE
jgi:parvulin-like peptidyl-prolyl isomerase